MGNRHGRAAVYQGAPCAKGHEGTRYRSTRACVACVKDRGPGSRVTRPPARSVTLPASRLLDGPDVYQVAPDLLGELFRGGAVSVQLMPLPESGLVQCVVLRPDKGGRLTDAGKVRTTAATPGEALRLAAANSGRFRGA